VAANSVTLDQSEKPAGYLELLRHNPNFRNLWFGQLISAAGDWFNNVALLGLALELSGSGLSAGFVLLATSLPFFLFVPIAGPIVDRYNRKHVMLIANFAGALAALTPLLVREESMLWLLYVGAALVISSASFFNPASQAIVPNLVTKRELLAANGLSGSTWGIMVMLGSGIGGLVSAWLGRDVVFIINAASFLFSNLLIWRVSTSAGQPVKKASYSTWGDFKDGMAYLFQRPLVMLYAWCKAGWSIAGGVLILLTVFAEQIFKAGDSGIGFLYAARGAGALLGPIIMRYLIMGYVGAESTERLRRVIAIAFIVQAVGYTVFALASGVGLWLAIVALIVGHCGGGITWVGSTIRLQQITPDGYRGRVFAIDLGLNTLTAGISTLAFGFALEWGANPVILAFVGAALFFAYGIGWGIVSRRVERNHATAEITEKN
jgi:MFS family permease